MSKISLDESETKRSTCSSSNGELGWNVVEKDDRSNGVEEKKPVVKKPVVRARAKVPFEKGYSQMDWFKLTRTHPDLAGLKGRSNRRLISMDEVRLHKTEDSTWTVLKGSPGILSFQPLSWDARLKIMKGVANGLAYLHEISPKKYVHGDLKPNNILLGHKMEPYISDFGVGRLANIAGGSHLLQSNRIEKHQSDVAMGPVISIASCYQAPEALKALKPSQKWDVYSYGVILLELISGRSPAVLLETSHMDLVRWIQFCIEEEKPLSDVSDPFLSHELDGKEDEIIAVLKIALACAQTNPEKRPSMRNVVETRERLTNAS